MSTRPDRLTGGGDPLVPARPHRLGSRRVSSLVLVSALVLSISGSALAQDGGAGGADAGLDSSPSADAAAAGDGAVAAPAPEARPIEPERLPTVEASLSAEEVELGALATLTIDVTYHEGDRVHIKGVRRLGPFEVLDRRRDEGSEPTTETLELDLISFEADHHEVPPVELMVVLQDGRTGSVSTEAMSLRVTDPLANEPDPQPRGDHQPRAVYKTDQRALWAGGILAALLIAGLLGLGLGRLMSRRRPKALPPPPPPRPPEEVALEKLEAIQAGTMLEEGEVKTFHVAVSEAVREYLGGRYHFDSLELTTEELRAEMDRVRLRGISREELLLFLRDTDMVKFAKWRPETERSRDLLHRAFDIVKRTTRAEILGVVTPRQPSPSAPEADQQGGADAAP